VAVLAVPFARLQGGAQAIHDPLLDTAPDQRPQRLRGAHERIEQGLRAPPERLEEAVHAVAGRRDSLDARAAAERLPDRCDRRKTRLFDRQRLGEMLALPCRQCCQLECENHHRAAGHAAQLAQACLRRLQW